ncbi:hypothetical protein AVEN_20277-1 [Araneus ventricosus]|uniref:Uncharacterized protein n=1 Tax=Araneus ventricosus TaxID=182803 RepID=A0A4Y2JIJ3_ARAVE|nr:hypothetical protein AVEN_20277-1 [Araneus ventricosus]
MFYKFVAHSKERLSKAPYNMFNNSDPTTPPTTESNKRRQPPTLGIPSLSAYLGASRNLYAQAVTTLNAKPKERPLRLIPLSRPTKWLGYRPIDTQGT